MHDGEKAVMRPAVVARWTPQGLDEAEESGEGGAQLMARIGHKVGPHLLAALGRRQIV